MPVVHLIERFDRLLSRSFLGLVLDFRHAILPTVACCSLGYRPFGHAKVVGDGLITSYMPQAQIEGEGFGWQQAHDSTEGFFCAVH